MLYQTAFLLVLYLLGLIQMMASSACFRDLVYFTFGDAVSGVWIVIFCFCLADILSIIHTRVYHICEIVLACKSKD